MQIFIRYAVMFIMLTLFLAGAVNAQQSARLDFNNLNYLEDRAIEVVEVNVDGKLLNLAKRVLLKVKNQDAKKVGQAINGLEGIYVRVYKFETDNEYNIADVEAIRRQLQTPGWEHLANVRSKKKNQKLDVYTMFAGEEISGVAVVISENRSITLVNVVGPIDIELLAEIGGKLNIPEISIEKDPDNSNLKSPDGQHEKER